MNPTSPASRDFDLLSWRDQLSEEIHARLQAIYRQEFERRWEKLTQDQEKKEREKEKERQEKEKKRQEKEKETKEAATQTEISFMGVD
jgi:hypothetical protein